VVTEGDAADCFYLLVDGTADVVGGGRTVSVLGPGDTFGEIALLQRVPRTATVRARTALRLQSLSSERFLTVVTGSTSAVRVVSSHIDELLIRYSPPSRDGG
jgi:CRP-like cAMP-binding protein